MRLKKSSPEIVDLFIMKYFSFEDGEKIKLFDEIAHHFYDSNFGQMSKADIELMMFHFYIEKMVMDFKDENGVLDYQKCSDYKISKDLGITQQRVRNLKVRNQLVYPIKYDWKAAFSQLIKNARYDKDTKKITLNIPDPNLYLEIQNFIEENGAYVEKQLNSKILQLRAEYFIELVLLLEDNESRAKIIKNLRKMFSETGKEDSAFEESQIGKSLLKGALDITTIAANLSALISPSNQIGAALLNLLTKNA